MFNQIRNIQYFVLHLLLTGLTLTVRYAEKYHLPIYSMFSAVRNLQEI